MPRGQRSTGLANTRFNQTPEHQQLLKRESGISRELSQFSIIEQTLTAIRLNESLMKVSGEVDE
jgi:hypothetical protein